MGTGEKEKNLICNVGEYGKDTKNRVKMIFSLILNDHGRFNLGKFLYFRILY